MSDTYCDLGADGTEVKSTVGGGDAAVYFGAKRVETPAEGNCVRTDPSTGHAIIAGQNDLAYLVSELGVVSQALGPCYGRQSVAIRNGHWAVVRDHFSYLMDGNVRTVPPEVRGGVGIADLNPDGSVQWMAEPDPTRPGEARPREKTVGGVTLRYWVERNGTYLGLALGLDEDQVVLVTPDDVKHTLYRGIGNEPHLTAMDDGRIGACWRANGGQAHFLIGPPWPDFHDPANDLPPVESVPILGRTFGLVCYCFNDADTLGNIALNVRPQSFVLGQDTIAYPEDAPAVPDTDLFAVGSGEGPLVSAEAALLVAREIGDFRARGVLIGPDHEPMRDSLIALVQPYDIASPRCFRNEDEPLWSYDRRMRDEYLRVKNQLPTGAECWPTVNIHQRYSGATPTLTVKEVVQGFIAACWRAKADSWPGMVLFRVGTSDVPPEIFPYVERFLSGITGVPKARIIPETPEESDMASRGKRLPEPFDKMNEIDAGNGEVALEFPDKIGGFKKIATTTPEGKDDYRPKDGETPGGGNRDWQPSDIGAWERYKKTPTAYVAERGNKSYIYPRA